jgi:hypothetical protein
MMLNSRSGMAWSPISVSESRIKIPTNCLSVMAFLFLSCPDRNRLDQGRDRVKGKERVVI